MTAIIASAFVNTLNADKDVNPLSIADRCDRCGSQAYVIVVLASGVLHLCGHDYRAHADKLASVAIGITDASAFIG